MPRLRSFLQALIFGAICCALGMFAMYLAMPEPVYQLYWSEACAPSV